MLDKDVGNALLGLDLNPQSEASTAQIDRIIEIGRAHV